MNFLGVNRVCLPITLAAGMAACGGGNSGGPPSPPVTSMATVVTTAEGQPASLTVHNGSLYWLDFGENPLKSVPVGGGDVQSLATLMENPASMAFAGTDVIWNDFRSTQTPCSTAQVLKRTSATGASVVLAVGAGCSGISNIAVAGSTAYWVATDSNQQELQATPVNGGATATVEITTIPIAQIVANGEAIYWLEFGSPGTSMSAIRSIPGSGGTATTLLNGFDTGAGTFAVDGSSVYYTTSADANAVDLVSRPLAGGASTTLVSSIPRPTKLIVAGGNVVWIDGGEVRSVPVGGGSPMTLAAVSSTDVGPFDVVFDGVNVVWTEATGETPQIGSVRAVLPTGGAVTTLYQSTDLPNILAVDTSSRVNWIDSEPRIARLDSGNSPQTVAWGIEPYSNFVVTGENLIIPDRHRVKAIPLAGGPPSVLVVDPNYVIGSLATDGTWLVWNGLGTGTVGKAPIAGGAATELVVSDYASAGEGIQLAPNGVAYWLIRSGVENACHPTNCVVSTSVASPEMGPGIMQFGLFGDVFAVDATGVYLSLNNQIVRAPLTSDGAQSTLVSTMGASELALDGASLYGIALANSGTDCVSAGSIFKVPTAGGAISCVIEADDGADVGNLAFDSTYVYFTDSAHQDIRRTPK